MYRTLWCSGSYFYAVFKGSQVQILVQRWDNLTGILVLSADIFVGEKATKCGGLI
jgi:hypothetical protein